MNCQFFVAKNLYLKKFNGPYHLYENLPHEMDNSMCDVQSVQVFLEFNIFDLTAFGNIREVH